ncbi:hypothetical protein XENOCAPTIV_010235, partial [Xenoophorus captivus]
LLVYPGRTVGDGVAENSDWSARVLGVMNIIRPDCLILEIPALPVKAGCDVTLHCRLRSGDITAAFFFIDKRRLGSGPELVLRQVRQSDEGSYWCSTDRFGKSPHSFLSVKGEDSDITSCLLNC